MIRTLVFSISGVIVRRDASPDNEEFIRGKEIILSAGTIGSPHILLLSGIGPREELEQLGIPVIADLPGVGKNLEDHLFTVFFYVSSVKTLSAQDLTPENLQRWAVDGRGALTSCVIESQAWCQVVDKGSMILHLFSTMTSIRFVSYRKQRNS